METINSIFNDMIEDIYYIKVATFSKCWKK